MHLGALLAGPVAQNNTPPNLFPHFFHPRCGAVPRNSLGKAHVVQMQRFIAAAGPILHTVTNLEVSLYQAIDTEDRHCVPKKDIAAVLAPIASACPLVHTLKLTGSIRKTAMAACGAAFKHLTSLEVVSMPDSDLELLSECFPQVTSTRITVFADWNDVPDKPDYYEAGITSCKTLTCLDVGSGSMGEDLWQALPHSLRELHMGTFLARGEEYGDYDGENGEELGSTIPAGLQLPSLRAVHFESEHMPLCLLADLLRAAPQLQSLALRDVLVPCSAEQIPNLVFLHEYLATRGLVVGENAEPRYRPGKPGPGLMLHFETFEGTSSSEFLSSLPVFERFGRVSLDVAEQPQLADLARVFPALRTLSIHSPSVWLAASAFSSLVVFPSLQILDLLELPNSYPVIVLMHLCAKLPLLQQLNVSGMDHFDPNTRVLKEVLEALGRGTVLNGRKW